MAFTEAEKDRAVAIVKRYDGHVSQQCVKAVRNALVAPSLGRVTIYRWYKERTGVGPPSLSAGDKKTNIPSLDDPIPTLASLGVSSLEDGFEKLAGKILAHALANDDRVKSMRGKEAITAAAIAVDKMRLLRNLPTEIVAIMPDVVKAIETLGMQPSEVFNAIIAEADARSTLPKE